MRFLCSPYFISDTISRKLTKEGLATLIKREIERWPGRTFNPSRVRAGDMRAALLDPKNGFSRYVPDMAEPAFTSLAPSFNNNALQFEQVDFPSTLNVPAPVIVHLFLQDHRVVPTRKSAADISLPSHAVADTHGQRLVDAKAVFTSLQTSFSAIKGIFLVFILSFHSLTYNVIRTSYFVLSVLPRSHLHTVLHPLGRWRPHARAMLL